MRSLLEARFSNKPIDTNTMRTYTEWQDEYTASSNSQILYQNLEKLATLAEAELKAYDGEREEGFLDLIGSVQTMLRTVAAMKHGVEQQKWLTKE